MGETADQSKPVHKHNRLEPEIVLRELERLERRIRERFPNRTLGDTCREIIDTARVTARRVERACRPNFWLRGALGVVMLGVFAGFVFLARKLGPALWAGMTANGASADPAATAQALESAVNLGILGGLAVWSLASLEARLRRRFVLRHLHELRRFAHVIDMHQLNKDPIAIANPSAATASSPVRDMTEYDLARYLDYCSEMLSFVGKLAALYSEDTDDAETIAAAADVETLTTNLGRKVWQKITMMGARR